MTCHFFCNIFFILFSSLMYLYRPFPEIYFDSALFIMWKCPKKWVPGRNPKSGFQKLPGSESEPEKWVPVGSSGFRVPGRNPKSGLKVPTKFFFVPALVSKLQNYNSWWPIHVWVILHVIWRFNSKFYLIWPHSDRLPWEILRFQDGFSRRFSFIIIK